MLDHDCVVVPQIGGFVTCNAPAKYVEEENLFLPPIRTVGFNERLKADDVLLVLSYATGIVGDGHVRSWEHRGIDVG